MCKKNSPDKEKKKEKEASTGCVRETPPIQMKLAGDKRNSQMKKTQKKPACVRETPQREI